MYYWLYLLRPPVLMIAMPHAITGISDIGIIHDWNHKNKEREGVLFCRQILDMADH